MKRVGVGEHCSTKTFYWSRLGIRPFRPHLTALISCDPVDLHQGASVRCNYRSNWDTISEHVEALVMAQMMKAAVVHEFGKLLKIEEVPIPTPGRGEVLIKVVANGVCHTDLHARAHWRLTQ